MIKEYYDQLYANKLDNLIEMNKVLEAHKLPNLTQEEMGNISRSRTNKEIELIINTFY